MKMKQKEYIKTGLTCMALLMFASVFTIATAEQVQSVQPTQPGLLPGQFVTPDGRYIMNESDFAKAVISSGTITVPITDDINERHNISRNTIIALNKKFNVPDNETVTLGCDFKKGSCTYEIKKPVKGTVTAWSAVSPTSPPSSFGGWAESANYFATSGTTSFHGHWKVPKAPSSKVGQLLYYFIALQPDGIGIIQPVLEWNKFHPYENLWAIDSWYEDINGNYVNGTPIRTNVGDSIAGYLEYEIYQGNPIQWWIFTDDITTGTESINHLLDGRTWYQNYVAFEPYGVNSCSTYPGGADFTGLGINNAAAPSWLPWINSSAQAICPSLGVNIVSPYEVQLKAFPNDTVGVYTPSTGTFYLKNSNSPGPTDITVQFGPVNPTDIIPLVGDWNHDGIDTIGIYQKSIGTFFLRNSNSPGPADITVQFGPVNPTDIIPLAGDWNGDGIATIGVYQKSTGTFYLKNSFTGGPADITAQFGPGGSDYLPIVGDWDGDLTTTIGVYQKSTSTFFLRNSNSAGPPDITVQYGTNGDIPVVGNWWGQGKATTSVYRPSTNWFYLKTGGTADISVQDGTTGDTPIVGDWDGK